MTAPTSPAPAIEAVQWFNTDTPPSLDALRGRVVVIETFQMLCPGSVSHGLPPARRIHETFSRDDVVLLDRKHVVSGKNCFARCTPGCSHLINKKKIKYI